MLQVYTIGNLTHEDEHVSRQSKEHIMSSSPRRTAVLIICVILACGCVGMVFGQRLIHHLLVG